MIGHKRIEKKTVYDSKIYSDDKMIEMAQKAAANGYDSAISKFQSSGGKDRIYDSNYNGLKFRVYLSKDINGNIFIDNVHIIK